MASIWVIEEGEYSDYRVVGVFSSRKNAQLALDTVLKDGTSWGRPTIAEWELDPCIDELRKGYKPFRIRMLRDGSVEYCEEVEASTYSMFYCELVIWKREEAPAYRGKRVPNCLNGTVLAKDKEHAIKIANERRTQLIAAGEF